MFRNDRWVRLLALAGLALITRLASAADEARGTSLFDGKSMEGWSRVHAGNWEVRDGVLRYSGGGNGWLRTNREYGNFHLVAIWRFPSGERWDSGLFVRAGQEGNPWPSQAYQVQMLKGAEGGIDGSQGARARPDLIKPAGEWNTYELTVVGEAAILRINGQHATVATGLTRPRGYIGWQAEGFPLEIKEVRIIELPAASPGADRASAPRRQERRQAEANLPPGTPVAQ
jgi:hypothetical protein